MDNRNPNVREPKLRERSTTTQSSPKDVGSDNDDLPLIRDDKDSGNNHTGLDILGAVFNLATFVIGVGIMALPATMNVVGLLLGLIAIVAMGIVFEISIELLVRFSVLCRSLSYGEVVQSALGHTTRIVLEIYIIINNAAILIVLIFSLAPLWFGHTTLDNCSLVIFLVLISCLAPLCSLEKINSLSLSSTASVGLVIVFVVILCLITFIKIANGSIRTSRMVPNLDYRQAILDLLVVIPIMTNAHVCQFNVQSIYNDLKGKSVEKMNKVGRITIILCIIIFAFTVVSIFPTDNLGLKAEQEHPVGDLSLEERRRFGKEISCKSAWVDGWG